MENSQLPNEGHAQENTTVGIKEFLLGTAICIGVVVGILVAGDAWVNRSHLPKLEAWERKNYTHRFDVAIVGNSMAGKNIDIKYLKTILGNRPVVMQQAGGAFSAYWYIAIKNLFVRRLKIPPKLIIVVFRDDDLTQPTRNPYPYRMSELVSLTEKDEPILRQLFYMPIKGAPRTALLQISRAYQYKNELRLIVYRLAQLPIMTILGKTNSEISNNVNRMIQQNNTEKYADTPLDISSFSEQLPGSFLPEMFEVIDPNKTRLVFVRVRRYRSIAQSDAENMQKYIADLEEYISNRQGILLDFSKDERLQKDHYKGVGDDHLNGAGKKIFTEMLGESLAPLLH